MYKNSHHDSLPICVSFFTEVVDLLQVFVFLIPPNLTYKELLGIHLMSGLSLIINLISDEIKKKHFYQPQILVKNHSVLIQYIRQKDLKKSNEVAVFIVLKR